MAKFELKIHDITTEAKATEKTSMTLIRETSAVKVATIGGYTYSLVGLSMDKQMYQPTSIIADIRITMLRDEPVKVVNNIANKIDWIPIDRDVIVYMFLFRQVTLVGDNGEIGNDFYVHEVIPEYLAECMTIQLRIFSPDKMLTLKQACRAFVGRKLGSDILKTELKKYGLPYNSSKMLECNIDFMQRLMYKNKDGNPVEHIFPYLVQYNESFYDLLARTTNRWGEFMYYEDGKLQLGYNKDMDQIKNVGKYFKITYSHQDTSTILLEKAAEGKGEATDGYYEAEAAYDKSMYDRPVQKSPRLVRGELGKFNGQGDKYAMKKFSSFFNTDKNIVSWIINTLVDDGVSVLQAISNIGKQNDKHDEKYFPGKGTKEQYGTYKFTLYGEEKKVKDAFNQFTEISTQYANTDEIYDAIRYGTTLECEQKAGRNMVIIDYDSSWPDLKLGDIINVNNENFIVVNISAAYKDKLTFQVQASGANQPIVKDKKNDDKKNDDKKTDDEKKEEKKNNIDFYPAVIPSGHVRYSGPQIATIKDTDDPDFKHRVRVLFSWQKDADVKDATPWVTFASKGEGRISTGKHNKDDEVIVGFINGNIERPYVLGGTQTKAPGDPTVNVDLDTPGSHYLRLTDGTGLGIAKFISGAFSPLAEQIFKFIPADKLGLGDVISKSFSENKYFEGGVTMSDYYGIYKISASTDQRNVTISSPWGDVKMDAFTGITISAPNGDVKIKGKNVTIEAGNNLKLESGTNVGWKLGNDKKFGDFSLASLGLTVAGAIANKVAEKFKPIDLKIVRSVVEVVMRPVEGALTVKSHRYMMLEAGKNECEYPKYAFNEEKKKKLVGKEDDKKNEKTLYVPDGFMEVFSKTVALIDTMLSHWISIYSSCLSRKEAFEKNVSELQKYSNDDKERPCKTIEELKDKLWDPDTEKVEIKEDDLGFKENVGEKEENVDKSLESKGTAEEVVNARISQKSLVQGAAIALREAIIRILSFEWTEEKVYEAVGGFNSTLLPGTEETIKKAMFKAVSKDNLQDFVIYKPNDKVKALDKEELVKNGYDEKKIKRLVCLSLIKELKLDKNRDTKVEEPTKDNILNDNAWNSYVNSLRFDVPEKNKEKPSLGSTLGTPFKKWLTDEIDNLNFKKSYNEMYAWADDNNGDILIGTNENTYAIKGGGRSATFDRVTSFNHEAQLKKIKDKLLGI